MHTTPMTLLERLRVPSDESAWARFVDLYSPLLLYWATQAGLTGQDAEDLVQEVFVVLVQKLPHFQYDPGKSFRGWLKTVAQNKLHDRQRRKVIPLAPANLADLSEASLAESFWDGEDQKRLVARALDLMRRDFATNTWKACWEHVVSGRSAADVAKELGISENAVYVAKFRVLRRLREELAGFVEL